MADAEWGKKHRCAACGAAFYDLGKSPAACPKCGEISDATAKLRADTFQRARTTRKPKRVAEEEVSPEPADAPVLDQEDENENAGESEDVVELEEADAAESDASTDNDRDAK